MPEKKNSFYITTTLPYVNAEPHIGFAVELLRADVINRGKKDSHEVFFNTGTDEHGSKIYKKAESEGLDVQEFVDNRSQNFRSLIKLLDIDPEVHFIRTTDAIHIKAAQEFWKRCEKDIEKKIYKSKYCVGCELEKTDSELDHGRCTMHPNIEIEEREEENYFFKFSRYQEKLLDLYKSRPDFVLPESRLHEIKSFVERGLEDFSISRLKSKMPWGIPVPEDGEHVMYVWFDALVSYISTLGWPETMVNFEKFWTNGTPTQIAGKDNLRQQAAMWQAMLMSAGITNSHQVIINGFINSGGRKMSKSLGNVIAPEEMVKKYGVDATRYLLLRHIHQTEDTDVTWERLDEWYTADLANGLGNLVSRIMKLAETHTSGTNVEHRMLNKSSLEEIWQKVSDLDKHIQETKPWMTKDSDAISELVTKLNSIACMLNCFMPTTSEKILKAVKENKLAQALFPRLNA